MLEGWNVRRRTQLEDMAWMVGHFTGTDPRRLMPQREQTEDEAIALVKAFSAMQGG